MARLSSIASLGLRVRQYVGGDVNDRVFRTTINT